MFTSKELDVWEILKRLKHLLVTTKTLKIQGNCKRENLDKRPMRQTFKAIIKRIVERSPLIQHLHFTKIWFDWTKDVSLHKFYSRVFFSNNFFKFLFSFRSQNFRQIFDHFRLKIASCRRLAIVEWCEPSPASSNTCRSSKNFA